MVDKATKKIASKRRLKKSATRIIAFYFNKEAFDVEEEDGILLEQAKALISKVEKPNRTDKLRKVQAQTSIKRGC